MRSIVFSEIMTFLDKSKYIILAISFTILVYPILLWAQDEDTEVAVSVGANNNQNSVLTGLGVPFGSARNVTFLSFYDGEGSTGTLSIAWQESQGRSADSWTAIPTAEVATTSVSLSEYLTSSTLKTTIPKFGRFGYVRPVMTIVSPTSPTIYISAIRTDHDQVPHKNPAAAANN